MNIGIIGHLGPSEAPFRDLASAAGHEVLFLGNAVDGARPEVLAQFIDRCAIMVLVVDATPAALLRAARAHLTRGLHTPFVLIPRRDLWRFAGLMAVLAGQQEGLERSAEEESRPRLRASARTGTRI